MKTNILLILTVLFTVQLTSAQVLWSENFNNLTLGNVGTDDTGTVAGQGGWYTKSNTYSAPYVGNNDFKIIAEPGRGNVLEVIGPAVQSGRNLIEQKGLELLWDNRTAGNDVLKIEYDFFTGNVVFPSTAPVTFWNNLSFNDSKSMRINYIGSSNLFFVSCSACTQPYSWVDVLTPSTVPTNTWLKLELYLDYVNGISYFTIPSLGISGVSGWFSSLNFSGMDLIVETRGSIQAIYKFDNIIISAVDTVPLSVQDFITNKFNVFPNPASNVVTITNNENISVEQIQVFDISGKTVKTQQFNNENQVQLNIEELASGTYMLHIQTNEGMAVKKIVRK